jgi:5-methyltetrahydropteroyltriglutamate--homocysteine methyltransferase
MSERSKPPFRADQVGSLIRPDNVRQARKDFEAKKISEDELKKIQQAAIPGVVKLQEDLGFKGVTDGEYNRGASRTWRSCPRKCLCAFTAPMA